MSLSKVMSLIKSHFSSGAPKPTGPARLNVAVIFGGRSVEHEISILSALQVIAALDGTKYQVVPIYITKNGVWYTGSKLLELANYQNLEELVMQCQKVLISQNASDGVMYAACGLGKRVLAQLDVIFPVLHGSYGEDGCVQGLFETMNLPYVGCGVLASALAMDKIAAKQFLRAAGLPVLADLGFYAHEWVTNKDQVLAQIERKFAYPLIVKPGNLGSSIGVSAVANARQLEDALDLAFSMAQRVLVEPQIVNLKELNCAVLGDHEMVECSVCEEPLRGAAILSYQDKYCNGVKGPGGAKVASSGGMSTAKRQVPAVIPAELRQQIENLAQQAFKALQCSGVVRLDFLVNQDNNEVYLCEVNTLPGSLAFYLWEPKGLGFTELLERLIKGACKRHREHNNLVSSYPSNILNGVNSFDSKLG